MGQPKTLTIQLGQITRQGLELFPGFNAISYRAYQWWRHVIACGLALCAPEADVSVWPVLLTLLAAAIGLAARAVGLGQRPEHRPRGQLFHLTE